MQLVMDQFYLGPQGPKECEDYNIIMNKLLQRRDRHILRKSIVRYKDYFIYRDVYLRHLRLKELSSLLVSLLKVEI